MDKRRHFVQLAATALANGYVAGFAKGKIFTGASKKICFPGLNCYSCPGALGSCPIGALQALTGSPDQRMAFYALGFLLLVGMLAGRLVCGWLCPFGLVQDLLYKIPFVKKRKKLPGDRGLRWLKFLILAGFVILLPMLVVDILGQGVPWFCKYICPSGTLMGGIPLLLGNEALAGAAGGLFAWKLLVLIVLLLLAVWVYRPFCRYLCPLGAAYGACNPLALYHYEITESCISCGKCRDACPMDIPVWKAPNSVECIRCGKCVKACPTEAIQAGWGKLGRKEQTAAESQ